MMVVPPQSSFHCVDITADGEVKDIVAFLSALDGEFPPQTMPRLPPTPGDLLTEN